VYTIADVYCENGSYSKAASHPDVMMKVHLGLFAFLYHFISPARFEYALEKSGLPDNKITRSWMSTWQRSSQHQQLEFVLARMRKLVRWSGGLSIWERESKAHRHKAIGFDFDQFPITASNRFLSKLSDIINIDAIFVTEHCPGVERWRKFIRRVFVDLCDHAFMHVIDVGGVKRKKREGWRQNYWKGMTWWTEYEEMMSELGDTPWLDVPTYQYGHWIDGHNHCRPRLSEDDKYGKVVSSGDPMRAQKSSGGSSSSKKRKRGTKAIRAGKATKKAKATAQETLQTSSDRPSSEDLEEEILTDSEEEAFFSCEEG